MYTSICNSLSSITWELFPFSVKIGTPCMVHVLQICYPGNEVASHLKILKSTILGSLQSISLQITQMITHVRFHAKS